MYLMKAYKRLPITFTRGMGDRLWDQNNIEYIDAISGIGVTSLGHSHPAITRTISDQASTLLHTSNLTQINWQSVLGRRLCTLSGMDNAFICNSGCEANEVALKIARIYGNIKGIHQPKVIVMENAFHGRTFATNSASSNSNTNTGFEYENLISGFVRVPFDDLKAIHSIAAQRKDIVAILVEPIQGEGGVRVFTPGYLKGLREICDQHQWLLMLDEVQTGIGRTGKWFAYQHEEITPDILTLAKALGNGIPIGACLASGLAAEMLYPGSYGSTFGGNPFASRVASTVLDVMEADGLVERAGQLGDLMKTGLEKSIGSNQDIKSIRGLGLMIGIEFKSSIRDLMQIALEQEKVYLNVTRDRVIRLLPTLISDDNTIMDIVGRVCRLVALDLEKNF